MGRMRRGDCAALLKGDDMETMIHRPSSAVRFTIEWCPFRQQWVVVTKLGTLLGYYDLRRDAEIARRKLEAES